MPAGSHRFQVGSISCTLLADGYCSYPAEWLFANAARQEIGEALAARRAPTETVLSPYTCMLIEAGRHAILVDTGAGEGSKATGAILARLEMEGIRPRNIDTVILTHAHPDHIGGALDARGMPAFPNARYVIAELEWEFWTAGRVRLDGMRVPEKTRRSMEEAARRTLPPLRFQIETVRDETAICPGVRVIPAPGHTPGHLAALVESDGETLLNLGDAAAHPLHLERPDLENGFDLDPLAAKRSRRELLSRAVAGNMRVSAFHFPFPGVGRVAARTDGGWDWKPGW